MNKIIKNFQNISYGPAPEDSNEVNSWIKNLKDPNNLFINRNSSSPDETLRLSTLTKTTHRYLTIQSNTFFQIIINHK